MPTNGGYDYFWQADVRRWENCRRQATADMVAAGWNPRAPRFGEVMRSKARKLWNKGAR